MTSYSFKNFNSSLIQSICGFTWLNSRFLVLVAAEHIAKEIALLLLLLVLVAADAAALATWFFTFAAAAASTSVTIIFF